jgi:hypothetical protein
MQQQAQSGQKDGFDRFQYYSLLMRSGKTVYGRMTGVAVGADGVLGLIT